MRIFIFLLLLGGVSSAQAQKEGNVWHFGMGAAVDFNSGAPTITTPSSQWTFEGCASIADANGNLLFYTNGGGRDPILSGQTSGKIWNRNHQVMYDMGNTEGGGFSSAQSSVIVPRPGFPGQYYLFTMEEQEFDTGGPVPGQPLGRGLSYFIIDMGLNGGLGGVAAYFDQVYVPSYEGLCIVRHSNGADYWIIVHQGDNSGLTVLPVTGTSVGAPVEFDIPNGTFGVIKAAPNGQWLNCTGSTSEQLLLRFNPTTGGISAPQELANTAGSSLSTEFSPDSKRLFVTYYDFIQFDFFYYDLQSANISNSKTVFAELPYFQRLPGQMQLGPDGNIYVLEVDFVFGNKSVLSRIKCPNGLPTVDRAVVDLPLMPGNLFFGLPNFDNGLFKKEDTNLSVDLGADQVLCIGQSLSLNATTPDATAYQWSNGASGASITVNTPGLYAVTVSAGCGTGIDTVLITQPAASANAGPDLNICQGATVVLQGAGTGTLNWMPADLVSNAGIANPQFTGANTATLILSATEGGCTVQDTVQVTVLPAFTATITPADTTIQIGQSVTLNSLSGPGNYAWSPATGLSCVTCTAPVATPDSTTTYVLTVTNQAGCTTTAQAMVEVIPPDCTPEFPNAFTPNGDLLNDSFKPLGTITGFELNVYTRWGELIYQGNTPWDGSLEGFDAPMDVYIFKSSVRFCDQEKSYTGHVTLIR
jgi:gliding motility-associated-like protein